MPTETTYSSLRENLATVLDEVVDQQDTVIVRRRGARDVALIPASELDGLIETAHLLRSPYNARRLMKPHGRAKTRKFKPRPVASVRKEILREATHEAGRDIPAGIPSRPPLLGAQRPCGSKQGSRSRCRRHATPLRRHRHTQAA